MDSLIRLMAYLIVGAVLLYCDILYINALRLGFEPDDFVIMPIKLINQEDKDGARGIALAQMLQARLKSIERDLADAQSQLSAPPPKLTPRTPVGANVISIALISPETVRMPTGLLEPANINVSVGSVQVGGVVAWIQNSLISKRTLTFTFYVDGNRTIVSGDASPLSASDNGALYFESSGSQDKAISDLAYALVLKHLTNASGNRIDGLLTASEFQAFADGLGNAAALKTRIANGTPARSEEFGAIYQQIWPIARKVSNWPELKYFAASLAESAGESEQAVAFYKELKEAAALPNAPAKVTDLAKAANVDDKIAKLSTTLSGPANPAEPFDVPVAMEGSGAHCSVYYEPSLGTNGSAIARAVMDKFDADFEKLTALFGGVKPSKPFNVIIKKLDPSGLGGGGAYHFACSDQTLYCDAKTNPVVDPDFTGALAATQAIDVFGALQNKGWEDCGTSKGTGLKRSLTAALHPGKLDAYSTGAIWLDTPGRPDYVSRNDPTDQNNESTGCAVLFLNYLHSQLNIPWDKIVQAGGGTLAETYTNLGLGNDAFVKFRQLLDKHYPRGKPSHLTTDNPFPLK